MTLVSDLLHEERTLITDRFYTSLSLPEELLGNFTYICGTVKLNRTCFLLKRKKQKRGVLSLLTCKWVRLRYLYMLIILIFNIM